MIPTIESIVEMLIAGECTAQQALSWIGQHMEDQSLRDSFAGFAMQGMLAHSTRYKPRPSASTNWHEAISEEAYQIADQMLGVRE